jgi:hypothetical protein
VPNPIPPFVDIITPVYAAKIHHQEQARSGIDGETFHLNLLTGILKKLKREAL